MGSHVRAARLAAAVSSVLALSLLVPLGGGTPAVAASAGRRTRSEIVRPNRLSAIGLPLCGVATKTTRRTKGSD